MIGENVMRYTINYKYYPDDPQKTEESRDNANGRLLLGLFFIICSGFALICGLVFIGSVVTGDYSENTLDAFIFFIINLLIVFAILCIHHNNKKKFAKKFFLLVFSGLFDICGILAFLISIVNLYNTGTGAALLIFSLLAVIIITTVTIVLYRKIEGYKTKPIRLFTEKQNLSEPVLTQTEYIFCHKCGNKLLADSMFCGSCGTKLK